MISGEAFQAALANVKRQSTSINWARPHADALKWHILIALEGAEPELRKADQEILGRIGELVGRRLRHDQPPRPDEDYGRGYNQAMRDVLEILGQVTP
jgi:hypothetical protein